MDDPVAILERQAETRVAELVPIRYGRMAVSPFTFFRGAAAIMAADLAQEPASDLRVQVCGDAASEYENEGERVVVGQRVMQAASDSFLGWATAVHRADTELFGKRFYGRQLRDKKGAAKVERMSPGDLELYARLCGACLARAHARSGKIAERADVTRKGHGFAREIADFAVAYADKNESDYEAMLEAEADGRIEVQRGV